MSYHVSVYVPLAHVEQVKSAVFSEGAGRFSGYQSCCWETSGRGQFEPLEGANPYIGAQNTLSCEEEVKLEFFCDAACIRAVIASMKAAHPYEVPAYLVVQHCHAFD